MALNKANLVFRASQEKPPRREQWINKQPWSTVHPFIIHSINLLLLKRGLGLTLVLAGVRSLLAASQIDFADRSGDGITIGLTPVDQRLIGAAKDSKE